jgi:hypothetical protein
MNANYKLKIFLNNLVRFKNQAQIWKITFIEKLEDGIYIKLESIDSDKIPLWGKYIDQLELI